MIRKYLFWIDQKGIKTYKANSDGSFELKKPYGNDYFRGTDFKKFFEWFNKAAAITENEYIDFCFLSETNIESPLLDYTYSSKSSWNNQEIIKFFDEYIFSGTYEIYYSDTKCFVNQKGNIYDKKQVKKVFLKCIPEFSIEIKEKTETESEVTSYLNKYFIERLNKL